MTQNDRILWILGDGGWHEKSEFYGFCVLHSRIAELRKKGHEIEYRREGNRHLYRLVSLEEGAGAERLGAGRLAPSSSESGKRQLSPRSRSRSVPLNGTEETHAGPLTACGESGLPAVTTDGEAGSSSVPLSGEQLLIWEAMAA